MPELLDKKPLGIIFDLDGTLYRMSWIMRPLLTMKVFPHCLRLPRFLKVRNRFAGIETGSRDLLMRSVCEGLSPVEKQPAPVLQEWIEQSFYPAFIDSMRFFRGTRPGLTEVLGGLRKSGMRLGVLSDYDFVKERLELLGIDPSLFHTLASSEASGALKPCASPFLSIARAWNLGSGEILVIGDRADTDGAAADSAGMQFIRLKDKGPDQGASWETVRSKLLSYT